VIVKSIFFAIFTEVIEETEIDL